MTDYVLGADIGPDDTALSISPAPAWKVGARLAIGKGTVQAEVVRIRGLSEGALFVDRAQEGSERSAHTAGSTIERITPWGTTNGGNGGEHPDAAAHVSLGLSAAHTHPYAATGHNHDAAYAATGHSHGGGPSIPAGLISMWHGLLSAIPSGWALCDGQNGTPDLRGQFIRGAAADPGSTGGAATHVHTVTQPDAHGSLSHTGAAVGNHSVTQPSDHSNHSVTQPTAAGEAAHTHGYSTVIAHTHTLQAQGSTTAATTGTHLMTSTATGGSSRTQASPEAANSTGSASGTTAAGSSHTHTMSGAAVDAHSAHNGAAVSAHSVTQPSAHGSQSHTGAAVASGDNLPPYYELAYIMKL